MKKLRRINIGLLLLGLIVLAMVIAIAVEGQGIRAQKQELLSSMDEFLPAYTEEILPPDLLRSDEYLAGLTDFDSFSTDTAVSEAIGGTETRLRRYFPVEGPQWNVARSNLLRGWYSYLLAVRDGTAMGSGLTQRELQTLDLVEAGPESGYGYMNEIGLAPGEARVNGYRTIQSSQSHQYFVDYTFQWIETEEGWRFNSINYPVISSIMDGNR